MTLLKLAKTAVLSIGIVVMLSLTGSRLGWGQGRRHWSDHGRSARRQRCSHSERRSAGY